MKIVITGAAGFIGAALVACAIARGHQVLAVARPGSANRRLQTRSALVSVSEVDLRSATDVQNMMRDFEPAVIIHAAWSGVDSKRRSERLQISDNVEAACGLVEAGAAFGAVKFVGIGSQAEYGLHPKKMSEYDLALPTSLYGAAKLAAYHLTRQLAAQANMIHAWIRVFSTYGPDDNTHWLIPSVIDQILAGHRPRTTLGEQRCDLIFIDDLANAVLEIATSKADGVFNVGSGHSVSVRSVIEKIRDLIMPDLELRFGEVPYTADQIWDMEADIARLVSLTGWSPQITLDGGLATTIAWHRAELVRKASSIDGTRR